MDNEELKEKLRGMLGTNFSNKEFFDIMDLMEPHQLKDFMEGVMEGYKSAIKEDPSLEEKARGEGILDGLYIRNHGNLN